MASSPLDIIASRKDSFRRIGDPQGLGDSLRQFGSGIDRFAELSDRHTRNVNSIGSKLRMLGNNAALATANQFRDNGTRQGSLLQSALTRAKARSNIVSKGENAIKAQQLRDRLAITQRGKQRSAAGLKTRLNAGNLDFSVRNALQGIDDFKSSSDAGLFGGLTGIAAGLGLNFFRNRPADGVVLDSVGVPKEFDFGNPNNLRDIFDPAGSPFNPGGLA